MSSMYFRNRREAGLKLAAELMPYRHENTAILALSPGGVVVGEQIALALHSSLNLLLTEPIEVPGLGDEIIGLIDQAGHFTYNDMIAVGQLEEYVTEMRVVIEEEKMRKMFVMAQLLSEHGLVDPHIFYGRHVIIVSDGLKHGLSFEAAVNFLKPIRIGKLIGAMPLVSVQAVDKLHIWCDEIHILNVVANYMDTNHYYDDNKLPESDDVINSINRVITKWA